MNGEPEYPPVIYKTGKGLFTSGEIKIEADFELTYYPENTRIKAILNHFGSEWDWELEGILDDGRKISCENLSGLKKNTRNYEFEPLNEDIIIGERLSQPIQYAKFPLVGFYRGEADFSIDGFNVQIIGDQNVGEKNEYISKVWNLQFEGLKVKIQKNNETTDSFLNIARNISSLLSLVTGNEIMFHRQIYFYENGEKFEIWRRRAGYEFGLHPIIPTDQIDHFLKRTLPEFQKWTEEDKKVFNTAVNYINSSVNGYIDDRIFRLCQAWELLSDHWIKEKYQLPQTLKELKRELKKTIKQWKKQHQEEDKDSVISDRIIGSLYWEKLYHKIKKLIDSERLNEIKLGLDLKKLIEIRNSVAHSGRIKNISTSDQNAKLLLSSQEGLRILLLRKLNYEGRVCSNENQWKKIEDIRNLLN